MKKLSREDIVYKIHYIFFGEIRSDFGLYGVFENQKIISMFTKKFPRIRI